MFRIYNDYNSVMNNVDQMKVWSYIIGYPVSLGQKIYNPFRIDNYPSCYLFERNGYVLLADWADRRYHGMGIVKAIELKDNLNYGEVLSKLNSFDFLLPSSTKPLLNRKKIKEFKFRLEVKLREYNSNDKSYWSQFGITVDQLMKEKIYPVSYYFSNSQKNPDVMVQRKADKLAYCISVNNRIKLYQPNKPCNKGKFLTNFNEYDIWGNPDKDSKTLIITKSFKDYMVLKYYTPYNVQVVPSESIHLNYFYVSVINDNYDTIIPLMDNDKAGKQAVERFVNTIGNKATGFVTPIYNDPAEYFKNENNINLINTRIKDILNDTSNYTQLLASNNRRVLSG